MPPPTDYADALQVLAEAGIIDATFAEELGQMARFRNRQVHRYWDIDTEQIHLVPVTWLGAFERCGGAVSTLAQKLDISCWYYALAGTLDISLGKANYVLASLTSKDIVKVPEVRRQYVFGTKLAGVSVPRECLRT